MRNSSAAAALAVAICSVADLTACGGDGAAPTPPRDAAAETSPDGSLEDGNGSPDGVATPDAADDAGPDAEDGATTPDLDAGPLVLPQVLDFSGDAGVLPSPRLVAVTFPGDDEAAQIGTFTKAIGASAYWRTVTSEYGVGAAVGATILETETAPAKVDQDQGDSETWLASRFDGTHPEWGAFDPAAIYLVFYPSTTIATPSVGGCGGAYHADIPITIAPRVDGGAATSGTLLYGIVFRCATSPDVGRPSGVNLTTFMASHEMVEAATDPLGTGFVQTSADHVAWAYFFGSEVGDMCAFHANAAITPADIGFAVQRTWSNVAAAALEDPCVPAGSPATDPLFLAAPLGQGPITLETSEGPIATPGFSLPAGRSITVSIRFTAPAGGVAGPWTVNPFTYTMEHGQPEPYLQFSPSTLTGRDGDVVPLTITRLTEDTAGGNGGDAVKLVSTMGSLTNEWYFAITN